MATTSQNKGPEVFPEMIKKMDKIDLDQFSFYMPSKDSVVTFTEIKKDTRIETHSHKKDVCNYLISGSLKLEINGITTTINNGEWFEIKKDVAHSLVCLKNCLLIEVWIDGFDD